MSVNFDKSKYFLLGSRKFKKDALESLKNDPMMMGGEVIGNAAKEKY